MEKIEGVYENNVKPYENLDDTHARYVWNTLYSKYTTKQQKREDASDIAEKAIKDFGRGAWDAVKGMGKGIADLVVVGVAAAITVQFPPTMVPQWATDRLNTFTEGFSGIDSPGAFFDAIGQDFCDTFEEEGLAYVAGAVTVEVVTTVVAPEAVVAKIGTVAKFISLTSKFSKATKAGRIVKGGRPLKGVKGPAASDIPRIGKPKMPSALNKADDILTDGSHIKNGKLQPNTRYRTGEYDYVYTTDAAGRISQVTANDLKLTTRLERLCVMGTYNLTHALLRITMPVEVRSHAQNCASKIQKTKDNSAAAVAIDRNQPRDRATSAKCVRLYVPMTPKLSTLPRIGAAAAALAFAACQYIS